MKTTYIKASEIDKKWFIVDATDKTLGRLSSKVAQILKGKNKPYYTPHMDMGDFVIIINAFGRTVLSVSSLLSNSESLIISGNSKFSL